MQMLSWAPITLLALQLLLLLRLGVTSQVPPTSGIRVLFVCPIHAKEIDRYLASVPANWLISLSSVGRLVFVVSSRASYPSKLPDSVELLRLDVDDEQFPPVDKELV